MTLSFEQQGSAAIFLKCEEYNTTRYSVIFQKFPSRVRVVQKNPSSIRVAGTRWTLDIRHLMQLSDLDNLLSVVTICYQLGESYLNVFLLHKMDNLLSVYKFYQYWIMLLSDFMR